MIRGISFEIPQTISINLSKILGDIDIKKYYWVNIENQSEIYDPKLGMDFFDRFYYNGEEFYQKIQLNHYIVFLKLEAFWNNMGFIDIHTYDAFQESSCQLVILIYDCEFVEIYSKDKNDLINIYQNAKINNYQNIQYITDVNDKRSVFDVL